MVEQRPFKALVLGSSPSQPTPPFFPLRVVFIGEMGSSRRVSSNAAKRRNAHNSAVYCSTFLALSRIAPGSIDSRCRKTFSVMPPFLDVPFCAGLDGQSGCVTGRDDGVSTGFAKLFTASIRCVQRSRLARVRTSASGGDHVGGDLAQSDVGSEGGFELLPRFSGSLATRVRLNVKSSASDCKPQASRRSHGTRTISASRGPQRKCRKSIPSGKKFFKFLRTSLRAFRRRTVDLKGGSTALNRATRPKDDQTKG